MIMCRPFFRGGFRAYGAPVGADDELGARDTVGVLEGETEMDGTTLCVGLEDGKTESEGRVVGENDGLSEGTCDSVGVTVGKRVG